MPVIIVPLLFLTVAVAFGLIWWLRPSAEDNFQKWRAANNLEVLSRQTVSAGQTPFPKLSMSKDETFYRVQVKTENGQIKSGWVRCAGKFTAFLSAPSNVVWDQ